MPCLMQQSDPSFSELRAILDYVDNSNSRVRRHILAHVMSQVVVPVLNHVMELVETDHERLHDYGNDRTYNTFQCLVNINMVRILRFGSDKRRHLNQVIRLAATGGVGPISGGGASLTDHLFALSVLAVGFSGCFASLWCCVGRRDSEQVLYNYQVRQYSTLRLQRSRLCACLSWPLRQVLTWLLSPVYQQADRMLPVTTPYCLLFVRLGALCPC